MTKEQQKKFKELKKALPKILKERIKKYKFKKKDFMIWYNKKDLFFDLLVDIIVKPDGRCYCTSLEKVKPLWLDDLLWDLLKMESNKSEALSLRTIGAFTVAGSEIFEDNSELIELTIDELEEKIDIYLEHFYNSIQNCTIDDFYTHLETSPYHCDLRQSLSLVYHHKYQDALDNLKLNENGGFKNGDLSINEAIKEYCEHQLSHN